MPNEMTERERARFLDQPRIATLTTITKDGRPLPTPIWYVHRDGRFYFQTGGGTAKERNIRRDNRVTVSVQDERAPYRAVIAHGHAELQPPIDWVADQMPRRYLGFVGGIGYRATAQAEIEQGETVTIVVTPTRYVSFDYGKETPWFGKLWLIAKRVLPRWL